MTISRRNFGRGAGGALIGLLGAQAGPAMPADASSPAAEDGLPRHAPERVGVSSGSILRFLEDALATGVEMHSFMLWRGGGVIAEAWWWPYQPRRVHMMHSTTKSFLSAAYGLAIAEGRLSLSDRVVSFFPERRKAGLGGRLERLTVEDLLTQTSGHNRGVSGSAWRSIRTSWIDEFLKIPLDHEPGAHFAYSSATSFMLSAIITEVTGESVHRYLTPRLFEPLGMVDLVWETGPENINPGGNGISCRTSDLLKLGILHLQNGMWRGAPVLERSWVAEATTPKRGNPYGYHWWTAPYGYYAYGLFGQFAFVSPDHDAVLAITSAVPPGERDLRNVVARHFPAMLDGPASPGDGQAEKLRQRCATMTLLPGAESTAPGHPSGVSGISFIADANPDGVEVLSLTFLPDSCFIRIDDARGQHTLQVGVGRWIESDVTLTGASLHHGYEPGSMRVVASGRWTADDTFEVTAQFIETAFRDVLVFRFVPDGLLMDRRVNVNSGPTERPTIRARRQGSPPSG